MAASLGSMQRRRGSRAATTLQPLLDAGRWYQWTAVSLSKVTRGVAKNHRVANIDEPQAVRASEVVVGGQTEFACLLFGKTTCHRLARGWLQAKIISDVSETVREHVYTSTRYTPATPVQSPYYARTALPQSDSTTLPTSAIILTASSYPSSFSGESKRTKQPRPWSNTPSSTLSKIIWDNLDTTKSALTITPGFLIHSLSLHFLHAQLHVRSDVRNLHDRIWLDDSQQVLFQ